MQKPVDLETSGRGEIIRYLMDKAFLTTNQLVDSPLLHTCLKASIERSDGDVNSFERDVWLVYFVFNEYGTTVFADQDENHLYDSCFFCSIVYNSFSFGELKTFARKIDHDLFAAAVCSRCGKPIDYRIRSVFNRDIICNSCANIEFKRSDYMEAIKAIDRAYSAGDVAFGGICAGKEWPFDREE